MAELNNFYPKASQSKPALSTVAKNTFTSMKLVQSPLAQTTKKIHYDPEQKRNTETTISSRPTIRDDNREGGTNAKDRSRNHQGTSTTSILGAGFRKEKQVQTKSQAISPRVNQKDHSPITTKNSEVPQYFPGARSTLKALLQKGPMDRSNFHEKSPIQKSKMPSQHSSFQIIKEQPPQKSKALRLFERQNEILKEQNELLKRQLMEIKNQLMFGTPTKKQELISNLRDTIKKQDATIRQLKLKLEISNKKVSTLNSLLQTKEEELKLLTSKVESLQNELTEVRHKHGQRYESIKEKLSFVIHSYGQVQKKFNQSQLEWLKAKQQWLQQKGIYLHRIQFLEGYISSHN